MASTSSFSRYFGRLDHTAWYPNPPFGLVNLSAGFGKKLNHFLMRYQHTCDLKYTAGCLVYSGDIGCI